MLEHFITRVFRNLPALIVLAVCAMITISQWRQHPRAAMRAALVFCWFLGLDLLALFWYTLGLDFVLAEIPQMEVISVSETFLSCLEGLGYIFVLLAVKAAWTPYRPVSQFDENMDFEERLRSIDNSYSTGTNPDTREP